MDYDPINEQLMILIRDSRPSLSELAEAVGLAISSVRDRLDTLKVREMITWIPGKHRTLELTAVGRRYLSENYGEDVFRNEPSVSGHI